MSFWQTYLICALGITISVILPILRKGLPRASEAGEKGFTERALAKIWKVAQPYLVLGIFSLVTALLIVAFAQNSLKDWQTALLAGYAWDATVQKATGK